MKNTVVEKGRINNIFKLILTQKEGNDTTPKVTIQIGHVSATVI